MCTTIPSSIWQKNLALLCERYLGVPPLDLNPTGGLPVPCSLISFDPLDDGGGPVFAAAAFPLLAFSPIR